MQEQKFCAWHWCAELSETPKSSSLISEESEKLAETAAECDEEPSSPRASSTVPAAYSEASNAEEEKDEEADIADTLPSTSETDA